MRLESRFNSLARTSHMRSQSESIIRSSYYGFSERCPGHLDLSAAHTHGVDLADVIQTEVRRLCDLRSGFNVSDGLNLSISDSHVVGLTHA